MLLLTVLSLRVKEKICHSNIPLLLRRDKCPLQGNYYWLCVLPRTTFCRLLTTTHKGPGSLANKGHQALVEMRMLLNWLFRHHLSLVFCQEFFCNTICLISGSSLRYSRRSFPFCDKPFGLDFDVKPHGFSPKMEANHTATPTHTHGQNGGGQNEWV